MIRRIDTFQCRIIQKIDDYLFYDIIGLAKMNVTVCVINGESVSTAYVNLTWKLIVSHFGPGPFALFPKGGYDAIPRTTTLPLPGAYVYYIVPIVYNHLYNIRLHRALRDSSPENIQDWLLRGADPNATVMGQQHIHRFCTRAGPSSTSNIDLLLGAGADPNVSLSYCYRSPGCLCNSGQRPLHTAIQYDNIEVIPSLLAAGASPFAPDANGTTPLELAMSTCNMKIIALFRPYIATWIGRGLISFVSRMIVRTSPSLDDIRSNFGC